MGEDKMVMPVAPMANTGVGNGLFGNGGDSWLGILFLIALCNGGFGFGGLGGWGGMMGMGMWGMEGLYPWLNNSQNINNGFRDQMLSTSINGIQNNMTAGFGDIQTALCSGFAGVNQNVSNSSAAIQNTLCNGFNGVNNSISSAQNAIAQQMYSNQLAELERSYSAQTVNTQNMNTLAMNLQNCCCENRANVADLKYTVATENCADRAALSEGIRDIIANQVAGFQSIKDQLCQDKIDAKNEEITRLNQQILMRDLAASQSAQTGQLMADNASQTQYIVNRVAPYPIPSYTVSNPYQSINNGCGCNTGCGGY